MFRSYRLALAALLIAPAVAAAQDARLEDGRSIALVDDGIVASVPAREVSVACARGEHICYARGEDGTYRAVAAREAIRACTNNARVTCFAALADDTYRTEHGASFTTSRGAPVTFTWRPERFTEATCALFREHSSHAPPETCDAYDPRPDAPKADDSSCRGDAASPACRGVRSDVISAESPAHALRIFAGYLDRIPYITW
jgi:hypothetical protein